jgi:hypothetical protein
MAAVSDWVDLRVGGAVRARSENVRDTRQETIAVSCDCGLLCCQADGVT